MHRQRLSLSLISELYDLEEDTHRLCCREAQRIGFGPPSIALRSIAAHANESLEELRTLTTVRNVRIGSFNALLGDTFRRVRDAVTAQLVDHEHAYRHALTTIHSGVDLVRLTQAAASDEGDDELAEWCAAWLSARERLAKDATNELDWFARHPFFARLADYSPTFG